jgi:hypothetical protein
LADADGADENTTAFFQSNGAAVQFIDRGDIVNALL